MKQRVIVGLSGGVDSATAAYLLKNAGYEVIGVTVKTWAGEGNRCCEIDEAQKMAAQMGIAYYVHNAAPDFRSHVVRPFIDEYLRGRTPNPCVECNRHVKWAQLLEAAAVLGAGLVATGHYASVARLANGRLAVRRAISARKDQSYALCKLAQAQLAHTLLPLGGYGKEDVRAIAARAGLAAARKPDSQEICFVAEGGYADYIERETETELPPEGNFVDEEGNILGTHKGILHYTVGQRKGLGLALGYPAYVKAIDAAANEVVIGGEASLYRRVVLCDDPHFMGVADIPPGEKIRAFVKIRYNHKGEAAALEKTKEGMISIAFDAPVRAPTPGQAAVFYDESGYILGSGTIWKAL